MLKIFIISLQEKRATLIEKFLLTKEIDKSPLFKFCDTYLDARTESSAELKRQHCFHKLSQAIENEISNKTRAEDRFIGVLDYESPDSELHALTDVRGMLVLAFPEIQWIPISFALNETTSKLKDEDIVLLKERKLSLTDIITLYKTGYSPLFDSDGLRGELLERTHGNTNSKLPLRYTRSDFAFSIDEETGFSFINAYTAYRFGYRAFPISSKTEMDTLLGEKAKNQFLYPSGTTAHDDIYSVTFEDICLEFPDSNDNDNKKKLAFGDTRNKNYPLLQKANLNVVTTAAGVEEKISEDKTQTLERYFRHQDRRQVSRKRKWIEFKEYCYRKAFNCTGGFWWGYWLANLVEALLGATGILLAFFYIPQYFLLVVLGVFLVHGALRQQLYYFTQSKLFKQTTWAKWARKRAQWGYMPKCYEGHCPIKLDGSRKYWEVARKPVAGIFGLRNKCQLPNGRNYSLLFRSDDIKAEYKAAIRNKKLPTVVAETDNGHAAPGVALEIATFLIRRAERMKGSIIDAEGAIHAAVLANTALELLKYKTPSVAIDALKWKHYYEVLAECSFVGVRASLDMNDRFIDIHNAMSRICRGEDGSIRESVFLSGMAELIGNIAKLLSSEGKVTEANFFTAKARRYHRKLLPTILRALFAYPEWVLRSWVHFTISFTTFIIVFALFLYSQTPDLGEAFKNTYLVMFAGQYNANLNEHRMIIMLAKQIGALHVGFIAANFFMILNRK